MFPAGEVSSLRLPAATVSDPTWSETAVRLVRMTNAVTVVNRDFSSVLDGVIVVDLAKTNVRLVDKYLGKAGAERFRQWHGIGAACP